MNSSSLHKKNSLLFLKKLKLSSSFFLPFTYIFTLIKLLPLFIITHDWNILHTNGISHYLIELTLSPILFRINNHIFSLILLAFFILVSTFPFIVFTMYYLQFNKYDVFLFSSKTSFKICIWLIYTFPYLLNQYIFTICVYNFFMKQHHSNVDDVLYLIVIIIQILFILFCLGISFVISILSIGPFYSSSTILVSKMGRVDIKWICFAIIQGIIEMEYFVEFKTMIYIKIAIRIIFVLYHITYLVNYTSNIGSKFMFGNIVEHMCFFSCLIEFCAMHTFKSDLMLLSADAVLVCIKLVIEIILALILNMLICYKEQSKVLEVFMNSYDGVNSKNTIKSIGYSILCKFILSFSRLNFNKKSIGVIVKLINRFQTFFVLHKETCVYKKECFCKTHKVEEIKLNFEKFYTLNEGNPTKMYFSFKEFCPVLFDYVKCFLMNEMNKNSSYNNGDLILLMILFHLECNKNYTMTYYYLDKYMHTSQYKNSIIVRIQIELIKKRLKDLNKEDINQRKLHIKGDYDESREITNQENPKLHYKNIMYFTKIEKEIQNSFEVYYEFLLKTTLNDEVNNSFEKRIETTSNSLKISKSNIIYYINSYFLTNNEKCLNFQICSKLSIYFTYFFGKIPPKLKLTFQPLTHFYNLSKYQINDNILLLRFSNSKTVSLNIEYISDSLLVELGYSTSIENKLDTLSDIIPLKYYDIYDKYLVDNILKGNSSFKISFCLLRDKFHFLRIYHMNVNVIITDKYVSLYAQLKTANQMNNCYVVLNNSGNIVGMSQEFNEMFYLNMKIVNTLQIVLFNDLLGINFEEENLNKTITIETVKFYENINLLSANMVFEGNQEENALIYQRAREAISKIKKSPIAHLVKTLEIHLIPFTLTKDNQNDLYCVLYFTIQNHNNINLLKQIIGNVNEYLNRENVSRTNKDILTQKIEKMIMPSSPKEIEFQSMTTLSKDKVDIIGKLNLIRDYGFAVLNHMYEIPQKIIDEVAFVNKHISLNKEDTHSDIPKSKLKTKFTKYKLLFQMKLFICVFIFFLCFTIFIEVFSNHLYNDIHVIVDIQIYCIVAKKIINSLATSAIGMLLIQNNIQSGIIDYGFNYDYQTNIKLLKGRTEDYLENFKKFRDNYYGDTFQSFSHLDLIKTYLQTDINFNSMDIHYNPTTESHTLYDIFNYLHLRLKQLIDFELNPLLFNSTDGNFKCKTCDNDINDSIDLAADSICVFVLRNFLTNINYPLIEIINYLEELVSENKRKVVNYIFVMNIANIFVILVLLLYQMYVYFNLSTELFVKWFINVCNLRFFSVVLVQKTKILKIATELSTVESITRLVSTKLNIANTKEENELLQFKINSIEDDPILSITPFHVLTEYFDWKSKLNGNTESKWQTNSACLSDNNTDKQSTIQKPLTKMNSDLKKKTKFQSTQFNKKFNFNQNKVLNSTNIPLQNASSISNLTSESFIQKTNKHHHSQIQSGNNIKDKKPTMTIHRSARIVLIMAFILLAGVISLTHYIVSKLLFDLLENYSFYESVTLLRSNYFHEVFLCYQMAIINNSPLLFEYKSSGYLNHTKQSFYLNSFVMHDVFNETLARYEILSDQFEEIISDTSKNAFQNNLIEFEMKVRQSGACKEIARFLHENKNILKVKLFESLIDFDVDEVSDNCQHIGGGYNQKGIHTAFESLVNYVSDNYRDFIKKGTERDELYNYNVFQESTIQTYQVETNRMLELLFFNYQIAILMDYHSKYNSLKLLNSMYLVCISVILLILFWIYLDKFTKFYVRMDNSIEAVRHIVISTIIY